MMPKSLKRILIATWVLGGIAICGVSAAAWLMRDGGRSTNQKPVIVGQDPGTSLRPIFDAPEFSLTDQDFNKFGSKTLAGKVYIADFIFTHCTTMCPIMTRTMHDVQLATAGMPVQLVSFTVDPENDTPPVLKLYAAANKADESRWHFLTGDHQTMWDLSVGMKLAVGPGDTPMQVLHSSRFLLVDGRGKVRGIYDYKEAGSIDALLADAKTLTSAESK